MTVGVQNLQSTNVGFINNIVIRDYVYSVYSLIVHKVGIIQFVHCRPISLSMNNVCLSMFCI
jgi:hypothetical protein